MPHAQPVMMYVTFPSEAQALEVARQVVKERLAACANLRGEGTSVYAWGGEIAETQEWGLLLKSNEDRVDGLRARVVALHPYDTPCVLAWRVDYAHRGFAEWLTAMTRPL